MKITSESNIFLSRFYIYIWVPLYKIFFVKTAKTVKYLIVKLTYKKKKHNCSHLKNYSNANDLFRFE